MLELQKVAEVAACAQKSAYALELAKQAKDTCALYYTQFHPTYQELQTQVNLLVKMCSLGETTTAGKNNCEKVQNKMDKTIAH